MVSRTERMRPLFGGAAFAVLLLLSACTSESADPAGSTGSTSPAATETTAGTTVPSGGTATTAAIDAAALLQSAVAGLQQGYHFTSVASVNGTKTLTAEGDRIGPASRFQVTTNGAVVRYISTGDATYAQPDGGDWDQLGGQAPVSDPVASLAAPANVVVVSQDGQVIRLKATVSAAALGVGSSGEADMDVVITDGSITELGYTTTVDGNVGSVATTIGPVVDATPITAPI